MIHLQGIGDISSIAASELQVGMRLVWNYGYVYDVVEIRPKGKESLTVVERNPTTGKSYERTLRQARQVAAYWPK